MPKYKEIVSMVLDKLKITSDDSIYTEEHIIFLAGRYRSFLLKQRYFSDLKKQIPESNYQTLCLELESVSAFDGMPCMGATYLRTKEAIPNVLPLGNTRIYTSSGYYNTEITMVSKDRMKYTGSNKWMQNITYGCIDPDGRVYLHSENPQFKYLECININGIFENAEEASEFECDNKNKQVECDILDREFPMEDALIAPLLELIVNQLTPSVQAPEDKQNDANDDLSTDIKN